MGLFGLVKVAGESVRADVKEWMGTDYAIAAASSALGLVLEETTNYMVQGMAGLTGWKATAYANFHRLLFSALYYFGGKSVGKPLIGLTASVLPVGLGFVDLLRWLMGTTEQGAGLALGRKIRSWVLGARASAGLRGAPGPIRRSPQGGSTAQPGSLNLF